MDRSEPHTQANPVAATGRKAQARGGNYARFSLRPRGVRFIQLYSGGGHLENTWDGHESIVKNHGLHAAEVDQPIAALLTDLEQCGLFDSTLVVWGGEFGRMPFSEGKVAAGRNHNP